MRCKICIDCSYNTKFKVQKGGNWRLERREIEQ